MRISVTVFSSSFLFRYLFMFWSTVLSEVTDSNLIDTTKYYVEKYAEIAPSIQAEALADSSIASVWGEPKFNSYRVFKTDTPIDEAIRFLKRGSAKVPLYFSKSATSTLLRLLGSITGLNDDLIKFPGYPSPIAHTIAGGALGAGLGYGGSRLLELFTGEDKKKRKYLTLLGLGLGAAPGAAMTIGHLLSGQNPLKDLALQDAEVTPVNPVKADDAVKEVEKSSGLSNHEKKAACALLTTMKYSKADGNLTKGDFIKFSKGAGLAASDGIKMYDVFVNLNGESSKAIRDIVCRLEH